MNYHLMMRKRLTIKKGINRKIHGHNTYNQSFFFVLLKMIGNISISSFCFAINMWNGIYINRISRFSSPTDKNQNTPPKSTIIIMIKIGKKTPNM